MLSMIATSIVERVTALAMKENNEKKVKKIVNCKPAALPPVKRTLSGNIHTTNG